MVMNSTTGKTKDAPILARARARVEALALPVAKLRRSGCVCASSYILRTGTHNHLLPQARTVSNKGSSNIY